MEKKLSVIGIDIAKQVFHPDSTEFSGAAVQVAYLLVADNDHGPLLTHLREVNQPVIRSRNPFSRPHPARLGCL